MTRFRSNLWTFGSVLLVLTAAVRSLDAQESPTPFLGAEVEALPNLPTEPPTPAPGAFVTTVAIHGPAEQAGLKVGDVIIEFGGGNITSPEGLNKLVARARVGGRYAIMVVRAGKSMTSHVTLSEPPPGHTPPAEVDPEVARLMKIMTENVKPYTQGNMAYELGKLGPKAAPAVELIAKRLGDNFDVRVTSTGNEAEVGDLAAEAMVKIGEPAVPAMMWWVREYSDTMRPSIAVALGKIGEPAIAPLIRSFEAGGRCAHENAVMALKEVGQPAVQPLLEALKHPDSYKTRRGAAAALGEIGSTDAVEDLIAALEDESQPVRYAAAVALGNVNDPRAVTTLTDLLKNGETAGHRLAAAAGLGCSGDKQAGPVLIAALEDTDDDVRVSAANALGALKIAEAVEPLTELIEDKDNGPRYSAYVALGAIGDKSAVQPLIAAMKNEKEKHLRQYIAVSLGQLADPAAVPVLIEAIKREEDTFVLMRVADALGAIRDPSAAPALAEKVKTVTAQVSSSIFDALEEIGKPAAAPLFGLVEDGSFDTFIDHKRWYLNDALDEITGVNHPRDAKKMLEWWEKNKQDYETH
jgi:HEAT repeat protein